MCRWWTSSCFNVGASGRVIPGSTLLFGPGLRVMLFVGPPHISGTNQYVPSNRRPLLSYNVWTGAGQPPQKMEMDTDYCTDRHIENTKWTPLTLLYLPIIQPLLDLPLLDHPNDDLHHRKLKIQRCNFV